MWVEWDITIEIVWHAAENGWDWFISVIKVLKKEEITLVKNNSRRYGQI